MEKFKSIFGKSTDPTFESMDGTTYHVSDDDVSKIDGVGDHGPAGEYSENMQIQTEMFIPRATTSRRQWGQPEVSIRPVQQDGELELGNFKTVQFEGENMMYVEEAQITAISEDVRTLGEIAQDMSVLLDDQGHQIEKIDKHVDNANTNVVKAGAEVEKTLHLMKSSKYKQGAITTTGCAAIGGAIGAVGGIPGVDIGAGVGGAVGLIGSTVASLF